MLDLLISGAMIMDGSGNAWYRGSVGVSEGKVAGIFRSRELPEACRVIDGAGLVLSPGFIDLHTHTDYTVLNHRRALSSLHAGVTAEAMGMCGHSTFPVTPMTLPQIKRSMALFSGVSPEDLPDISWKDLAGWLEIVEKQGLGINVGQLTGHGMLRSAAMGPEGKGGEITEPSHGQMEEMKRLLEISLEQGSLGLATGLAYPPGRNCLTGEVSQLAALVSGAGGVHISHIRNEAEHLAWAVGEIITIARETGVRSSVSHHKAMGWENWGKTEHSLAMLEEARREGAEISCDFYPWEYAAQSNLGSVFYPSFDTAERSREHLLEQMREEDSYQTLMRDLLKALGKAQQAADKRHQSLRAYGIPAPQDVFSPATQYVVHSPASPHLVGLNLLEVAHSAGRDCRLESILDTLREVYLADEGHTYIAGGKMGQEDLDRLIRHPLAAISTDGWTLEREIDLGYPALHIHPRQYGSHALVLGSYARDRGVISLEEAIRKMSSLPAQVLGLSDRGLIRPGFWADLVLFDPRAVANRATHGGPSVPPVGIRYVLVNGQVALEEGKHTGVLAGQVLRRGMR